jgi:hypothetical protein
MVWTTEVTIPRVTSVGYIIFVGVNESFCFYCSVGALALVCLLAGLLLRLLADLLLPPVLLILPSNIDIASQCGVVLFRLLKFFLDINQFIF